MRERPLAIDGHRGWIRDAAAIAGTDSPSVIAAASVSGTAAAPVL
jgi:hypothetical protein